MSKNKIIIIAVLVATVVAGLIFYTQSQNERVLTDTLVENSDYSLSFNYLAGEDGYELIESNTSDNFLQSYVLVEKSALTEFQANGVETAPPTMSVFIFQLPEAEEIEGQERPGRISRLQNWAQNNAGITSFGEIYGTPEVVEVDGVKALEYFTGGTYNQTVYLASYRGFIYMFVGQFERPTDYIANDFEALIQTVRFE